MLYNSSKLTDITDDIIKLLNKNAPPARTAPDSAAPSVRAPAPATPRRNRVGGAPEPPLLVTVHTVRSLADQVGGTILGDGAETRHHRHQRSSFRAARPDLLSRQREVRDAGRESRAAAILVSAQDAAALRLHPDRGRVAQRGLCANRRAFRPAAHRGTSRAFIPPPSSRRMRIWRGRQRPAARRHRRPRCTSARGPSSGASSFIGAGNDHRRRLAALSAGHHPRAQRHRRARHHAQRRGHRLATGSATISIPRPAAM